MTTSDQKNTLGFVGFVIALFSCIGCGVLSVVGFFLSFVGCFKQPRGYAITGMCVSLVTAAGWTAIAFSIYLGVMSVKNSLKTPLQAAIGFEAKDAADEFALNPPTGDSGSLSKTHWTGHDDVKVRLAIDWDKVGDRYRVRVQPAENTPKDQTGDPITVWALPDGNTAMSLADMRTCAVASKKSIVASMMYIPLIGLIDQMAIDVEAIASWSKEHEQKAPSEEEGNSLLGPLPEKRTIDVGDNKSGTFTVKKVTYSTSSPSEYELEITYGSSSGFSTQSGTRSFRFTVDGLVLQPFQSLDSFGVVDMREVFD